MTYKPVRLNKPVLYLESLGVDLKSTEHALLSLSRSKLAKKHSWGYTQKVFQNPFTLIEVGASWGGYSCTSFHSHIPVTQAVSMVEGSLDLQIMEKVVSVFEEDNNTALIAERVPHRLIFPKPCLFVEVYNVPMVGGLGAVYESEDEYYLIDPPITRFKEGSSANHTQNFREDEHLFYKHTGLTFEALRNLC